MQRKILTGGYKRKKRNLLQMKGKAMVCFKVEGREGSSCFPGALAREEKPTKRN